MRNVQNRDEGPEWQRDRQPYRGKGEGNDRMDGNRNVRHHFFLPLLKRQLKKPGFYLIALLCLFFLYVFVEVVFPSVSRQEYGVFIGDTVHGEQLKAVLKGQEDAFRMIEYTDRKSLEEDVTSGKVDCGFVLDSRIDGVSSLNQMEGIADYICSTSTLKGELLKEKGFSAILQVVSGNVLSEIGRSGTVYEEQGEEISEELLEYYRFYLEGNYTIQIAMETVELPQSAAEKAVRDFRGSSRLSDSRSFVLCGILIFACALIFARNRFSQESRNVYSALRGGERHRWRFLELLIPVLLITLVMSAAFVVLQLIRGEESFTMAQGLQAAGILLLCGIACTGWGYVYSRLFPREEIYLFTVPVIVILAIVTCPAILDLEGIIPAAGVIKWIFPVSYL